jgi:hypothetical protein
MNEAVGYLYEPLGVLKPVAERIWIVDGAAVSMRLYGLAVPFPTRMTVVQLGDGSLWCHSPVQLDAGLRRQIDALGAVRHLVSPNKLHYAHIAEWARAYPQARCWASPGVRERAAAHRVAVSFDADLGDSAPPDWAAEIEQLVFRGSRFLHEVVFFHKASATLVLTDLIENFEPRRLPRGLRWLLRLSGAADPDGKLPFDLRLSFWGHRRAAARSLQRMLAWRPERVLLAHGRCYAHDGVAELQRAFRWLQ